MNLESGDPIVLQQRVEMLEKFHSMLSRWFDGKYEPEGKLAIRSYLNRNVVAVRNLVNQAGTLRRITMGPPPAIGGIVIERADPFENLFQSFWGVSLIPTAMDSIEQAIGVYSLLQSEPGLVNLFKKESIDIESAIERSLRPSFRSTPPSNEKDVQDSVEDILNALGVVFTREKDIAPVGARAFKPDFVLESLHLAVEVKLAKKGHSASSIQEEIAADITAYRTRWKHIIFVIYDLGEISDPHLLRRENMRLFGVSVIVIKH